MDKSEFATSNKKDIALTELTAATSSARLYNSLQMAERLDILPAKTAIEFAALGPKALRLFMRIPNMGRKTFQELEDIVSNYLAFSNPTETHSEVSQDIAEQPGGCAVDHTTLFQIVKAYSEDRRLINIFSSSEENPITKTSVDDWRSMPERVKRLTFFCLKGFGERSFDELQRAVSRYEVDSANGVNKFDKGEAITLHIEDATSISDIVLNYCKDGRLKNFCQNIEVKHPLFGMTVKDWLTTPEDIRSSSFLAIGSLGKKSLEELNNAISDYLNDLGNNEPEANNCSDICSANKFETLLKRNEYIVDKILQDMSPRKRDILKYRYYESHTLEEVGKTFNVTRERIRQIEKKALRQFASFYKTNFGPDIEEMLFNVIWEDISFNGTYLAKRELSEKKNVIKDHLKIACAALSGSIALLISKFTIEMDLYWIHGFNKNEVDESLKKVSAAINLANLPLHIRQLTVTPPLPEGLLDISLKLLPTFNTYKGIINKGPLTIRKKRLVELWLIIAQEYEGGPAQLMDLHTRYLKYCPTDQCTARDMHIVLAEYPHVFQKAGTLGWILLSNVSPLESPGGINEPGTSPQDEHSIPHTNESTITLKSVMEDTLLNSPMTYKEIFETVRRRSSGAYSKGSIAALLSMYPEFDFFGPGVIGLHEKQFDENYIRKAQALLLQDIPIRQFILSKIAGAPLVTYPAWNEHFFSLLVAELQKREDRASLGTLLEHIDFSADEIREKRYEEFRRNIGERISLPEWSGTTLEGLTTARIIRSAWLANKLRGFNWILGNRVTGERLDSLRKGPNIVMLLVAIGILDPDGVWFRSKNATTDSANIVLELTDIYRLPANSDRAFWRYLYEKASNHSPQGCLTATRKSELLSLLEEKAIRSIAWNSPLDEQPNEDASIDESDQYFDLIEEQLFRELE